jgi:hypothetical protein
VFTSREDSRRKWWLSKYTEVERSGKNKKELEPKINLKERGPQL